MTKAKNGQTSPEVSIVIPVYNEGNLVGELVGLGSAAGS